MDGTKPRKDIDTPTSEPGKSAAGRFSMSTEEKHGITITTRDRLLRAWENSTELTRDFEIYSKEISDDERTSSMFANFARDEGLHAAKLLSILREYDCTD